MWPWCRIVSYFICVDQYTEEKTCLVVVMLQWEEGTNYAAQLGEAWAGLHHLLRPATTHWRCGGERTPAWNRKRRNCIPLRAAGENPKNLPPEYRSHTRKCACQHTFQEPLPSRDPHSVRPLPLDRPLTTPWRSRTSCMSLTLTINAIQQCQWKM